MLGSSAAYGPVRAEVVDVQLAQLVQLTESIRQFSHGLRVGTAFVSEWARWGDSHKPAVSFVRLGGAALQTGRCR